MRPTTRSLVKQTLQLLKEGKSIRQVASHVGISKTTVHDISKSLPSDRPMRRAGRPKKVDRRNALYIRLLFHRGRISSASEATRGYNETHANRVCENTIRQALRDIGMNAKRMVKKPRLTKAQKKARLDFALAHQYWTEADWKKVIWSDESKVNRVSSDGKRFVWVQERDEQVEGLGDIDPKLVDPTLKHGGGSVMVWSCMTWDGPGYIAKIDSTMDSDLYIRILSEELQYSVDWYKIDPHDYIFQQDNDPKHTAKRVKRYLASIGLSVAEGTLLDWPSNSPDMNPMEHLWDHLKRKLREKGDIPDGVLQLWDRIRDIWEYETPMEVCRNLIRSVPKRMQAVIAAKGGNTRY